MTADRRWLQARFQQARWVEGRWDQCSSCEIFLLDSLIFTGQDLMHSISTSKRVDLSHVAKPQRGCILQPRVGGRNRVAVKSRAKPLVWVLVGGVGPARI